MIIDSVLAEFNIKDTKYGITKQNLHAWGNNPLTGRVRNRNRYAGTWNSMIETLKLS